MKRASGDFEFGSFRLAGHRRVAGFLYALGECPEGRTPIHAAPLMGPLGVVALKVCVEHGLHLLNGLKPSAPPLDPALAVSARFAVAYVR